MLPLAIPFRDEVWPHDYCPGYYVSQRQIVEAVEALDAYKSSNLDAYFPGLENPILQAARELNSAFIKCESRRLKEQQRNA